MQAIKVKLLVGTGIPIPETERGRDCPPWLRPGDIVEVADRSWAQRLIAKGDVALAKPEAPTADKPATTKAGDAPAKEPSR